MSGELAVLLGEARAGTLRQDARGAVTFAYEEAWRRARMRRPSSAGVRTTMSAFAFFLVVYANDDTLQPMSAFDDFVAKSPNAYISAARGSLFRLLTVREISVLPRTTT